MVESQSAGLVLGESETGQWRPEQREALVILTLVSVSQCVKAGRERQGDNCLSVCLFSSVMQEETKKDYLKGHINNKTLQFQIYLRSKVVE